MTKANGLAGVIFYRNVVAKLGMGFDKNRRDAKGTHDVPGRGLLLLCRVGGLLRSAAAKRRQQETGKQTTAQRPVSVPITHHNLRAHFRLLTNSLRAFYTELASVRSGKPSFWATSVLLSPSQQCSNRNAVFLLQAVLSLYLYIPLFPQKADNSFQFFSIFFQRDRSGLQRYPFPARRFRRKSFLDWPLAGQFSVA